MNRAKKEEAKKLREAYESMSPEELEEFERRRRIKSLAEQIHSELFPEEYDFMMDSIADAKDRRRGINPMSDEYTAKVNARRKELGVSPLGDNGMPTDNSSWDVAHAEAIRRLK
ncbi:hypothetical protein GCM10011533_22740 [Streptosporangium jomthongense]|uniref:Uncharacterized protein n=1 Tax=Marinobacter aromaticivorans TaxID=1494078 RepID=A0ABW2IX69_9GAMM|nr:hypothetical protein [Marinobacter aromaticivorans]GGE69819.1 hypothetical protein GCM10011533_22740 [Streptosporangium jomthongense]